MIGKRFVVAAAVLMAGGAARAEAPPRPFLIVCETLAPYEYPDAEGRPSGINVEIIDRIFTDLEISYEIRFYPWARAWLMVVNGAADAVLSISHQRDREDYLLFSDAQKAFWDSGVVPPDFLWLTEYVFFVPRHLAGVVTFDSYDQIKRDGLRVVINDQYSYEPEFLQSGIPMTVTSTPEAAMKALLAGEGDLYPMDRSAGWALLQREGLHERITWLPKPLFMKPYLFGVARASDYPDRTGLLRRFYERLRELRRDGTIDAITARHLDPVRPDRSGRSVRFVCEEWRPFEYTEGGEITGINANLVQRIMQTLRIPYEIRGYPWPRAWLMAEQGQADAVLSVSYHPDRETVLYFTDGQRAAAQAGTLPHDHLWISRYVFYVKNKHAAGLQFESYDKMIEAGCRVGLNHGYSYAASFPSDQFLSHHYFDVSSAFLGLIKEEIDVYPMDRTVGSHTLQQMGLQDSISRLPPELFSKAYLVPFVRRSDYPGLESIMYEFYHQLRQLRAVGALTD